jgi:hypothetical protein
MADKACAVFHIHCDKKASAKKRTTKRKRKGKTRAKTKSKGRRLGGRRRAPMRRRKPVKSRGRRLGGRRNRFRNPIDSRVSRNEYYNMKRAREGVSVPGRTPAAKRTFDIPMPVPIEVQDSLVQIPLLPDEDDDLNDEMSYAGVEGHSLRRTSKIRKTATPASAMQFG